MPLILIVDDDPDMAELLGHMTDILGYEHQYVPTGAEALEACRTKPPDAIVLDVMLEETDGWAVFRQLVPITDAPIIFITAFTLRLSFMVCSSRSAPPGFTRKRKEFRRSRKVSSVTPKMSPAPELKSCSRPAIIIFWISVS